MCERGVEVARLFADALFGFRIVRVAYLPHQVHPVRYHNENDPHVLGERKQEVTEILAFDYRVLFVKFLDVYEPFKNVAHSFAEMLDGLVERRAVALGYARVEQNGNRTVSFQSYFLCGNQRSLHA